MTTQVRNPELVELLKPDFITRSLTDRLHGAAVFNNAAIPVGSGAWQALTFNQFRWNDAGFWAIAPNPSRLTVPVGYDGRYVIAGHFQFDTNAGGTNRMIGIRLNNAFFIGIDAIPFGAATWSYASISTVYDLVGGNFVELTAWQDTGAPLNVLSIVRYSPEFRMERVGG